MIGKKINQLATELAPTTTDLTIIGDPVTGVSKKITLEQLGAIFGGAVSFYTTLGDFPATGVIDIIYCAKDTKKLYLWSGSAYVEVFPSQSLLDTYQLRSEKGVSNGYASLDVNGKVPIGQLPNSIMEYKGTWNAATNTPTLANGTGDTGDVYICNAAGTVNFGAGPITFAVGDYVVYSGTIWQRSSGAVGTVTSVAVSRSGDALAITGSPITTSGTINLGFAGTGAQYIKGDGTLATFPSIISQAQNLVTEVYNNTGATLTKGTIVYINGGQGNLPTVTKALATGDSTSAQTYGVVQTDITNMNNGYVVVAGRLTDLDTQAYSNGTQLYLSPTTAGTFTSTKPYAPQHLVYVGIVVRSHPTQGVVEIKIQNGYELDELHNVAAQSPDNNDILQYKTATSLWTKVAGTTSNIAEGTNLYYTDARSRAALSFTAGSGAYNSTTGVITIPTNTNQLTNGASFITLASLSAGAGISYNNTTGVIASTITQYTDALARAAISLTTTGTSGAATYNNTTGVLNIPQYQTALTNPVTGTGTTNYLPKFTGTSTIGNSSISDNGTGRVSIGTTSFNDSFVISNSGTTGWEFGNSGSVITYNRSTSAYIPMTFQASSFGFTGAATFSSSVTAATLIFKDAINSNSYGFRGLSGIVTLDAGSVYPTGWNFQFGGGASSALYINGSGNVGIGTTNPTERLHINNSSTNAAFIRFQNTGGDGVYVGGRNNDLEMYAGGSLKAIITSGGIVQVNTTASIGGGVMNLNGDLRFGGAAGASYSIINYQGGSLNLGTNNATNLTLASTGAATFSSSVTASTFTSNVTSGIFLNNGSGGTNATQIRINNTGGDARMGVESSTGGTIQIGTSAYSAVFGNQANAPTEFTTNGTVRMSILGNGNVGIGTTSPSYTFDVNKTVDANFIARILNTSSTGFGLYVQTNDNTKPGIRIANASGGTAIDLLGSGAATFSSTIKTASPSSGSAHPWKLGSYAAGGTGTATGVIYIEVNGQIYSIPALLGTP